MQLKELPLSEKQQRAVTLLEKNDGGIIWWRVGTGKTRVAYSWFAMVANSLKTKTPMFIVVCRRQAFDDWFEEAKFKLKLDWTICNYETYGWGKRTRPTVLLVSHGIIHKVFSDIMAIAGVLEAVVFDEGFLYKNSQSKHCSSAHKISARVGRAAIMSGSIMTARNVEDLYGQAYAIDQQDRLARTLTEFRSKYQFKLDLGTTGRTMLVTQAGARDRIMRQLAPIRSTFFPASERKLKHIHRNVEASKEQQKYIKELKTEYFLKLTEGVINIKNNPSLIIKCQQLSDGFIKFSEGGVRHVHSPKMDRLIDKLAELLSNGESVVVWVAFRYSVDLVLQALQKAMPSFRKHIFTLVGGKRFDTAGWRERGRVVIATEDSGSSVNHFSQCAYALYYSISWKWLSLQQSRGRTDRKNSKHTTAFYYYLFTEGSLDRFVYDTAVKSGRAEKELIDYKELTSWVMQ